MRNEPITILHVEDNVDHARIIARCLQKHGLANDVRLVEDGETALDYLFRRGDYRDPEKSPRPDIILLDLRLPKLDGLEVLRTIKTTRHLRSIPVIILTSSETDSDLAQAYQCRANSYLLKPVNFDELSQLISDLGSFWLGWNRQLRSAGVC